MTDDAETLEREVALASSCGDDLCIRGELRDTSPAPGIQPECTVSVFLRSDDEPLEYVVPPCTRTGGDEPCFQPVLDRDACPRTRTGLRMDVRQAWGDDVVEIDFQCVRRRRR